MEIKTKVNAGFKVDSQHLGEILRSLGDMSTTKILIIASAVVVTALICNLEGIIKAIGV